MAPRGLTEQHLEEDDPDGPDVMFGGVLVRVVLQELGGHVQGRTYATLTAYLFGLVADVLGEPEVSYFEGITIDEDVGRFEVSVDVALLGDLEVPVLDLS